MSKFPFIPLFTDAFLADTGHLTAQETGAYCLLLMVAWRTPGCALPDNDAHLAKWARVDPRTWRRIKPTVMSFWQLCDGRWTQGRLSKELEIASKHAEASRENGKHGGRPKSLKNKEAHNPAGSQTKPSTKPSYPIPTNRDDDDDTRTRAKPSPNQKLVSDEAFQLSDELAVICGHDPANLPPQWHGSPMTVQKWFNEGWHRDSIIAAVRRVAGKKPTADILSAKFFEREIARLVADYQTPVPVVKPGKQQTIPGASSNGRRLQNDDLSVGRAAERLAERAERGEVVFGPRPSLLPAAGESDRRLLPPRRGAGS